MNLRQNSSIKNSDSLESLSHVIYLVLLWSLTCFSLSDRFVRYITENPHKVCILPRGFSHDKIDMYVQDTATWKDRLLLTFASAVAIVAIATPSCWRRNGRVGTRVAGAGGLQREVDYKSVSTLGRQSHIWQRGEWSRQTVVLNCGEGQQLDCCYDSSNPFCIFLPVSLFAYVFIALFVTFMLCSFVFLCSASCVYRECTC